VKLKRRIDKAAFEALPKDVQAFYSADGAEYALQLESHPDDDPAELRRARDREKENARTEKERADRLQGQVDSLVSDPNKAKDLTTLENSWKNKLTDKETAWNKEKDELTRKLNKALVEDKAMSIALKLTGGNEDNAVLLKPHLLSRLTVDTTGDEAVTRVLDTAGKPSAATLEEFEKEIVANKTYSGIIVASKASGGADPSKRTSTSQGGADGKKFNELTDEERKDWFNRDPQGFKAASAEFKKSLRKF
jgi:hypothetical protein